jgi:hypothetical protein
MINKIEKETSLFLRKMSTIEEMFQREIDFLLCKEKTDQFGFLLLSDSDQYSYLGKFATTDTEHVMECIEWMRPGVPRDVVFMELATVNYFPRESLYALLDDLVDPTETAEAIIERALCRRIAPLDVAIRNLFDFCGVEYEEVDWMFLYELAKERGYSEATLFEKYVWKFRNFAEFPKWVTHQPTDTIATITAFAGEELPTQESFNHILHQLLSATDKNEEEKIVKMLLLCNDMGKMVGTTPELDRVFGLSNPKEHKCLSFDGSCRMFECCCHVEGALDDKHTENNNIAWFGGECLCCGKTIRKSFHSLRIPLEEGGWKGCYCSEKCLYEAVEEEHDEDIRKILRTRAGIVGVFVSTVGVADRNDPSFLKTSS